MRILVPVDAQTDASLLALAADLTGTGPGVLVLLAVVEMPLGRQPVTGAAQARAARHALRRLAGGTAHTGLDVRVRVRAARALAAGVREVADEERPNLLLLATAADGAVPPALRELIAAPPCDLVIARVAPAGAAHRSVLVPARGGPTSELALALALNVAARRGAHLTVLRLDNTARPVLERSQEEQLFRSLLVRSDYPRLRSTVLPAADVQSALLAEAERHDLVMVGAGGSPDVAAGELLGAVPDALLGAGRGTVLVAKPRLPVDPSVFAPQPSPDVVVDKWVAENTFHCREFADVEELVRLKRRLGLTVSVALMPAGESDTLPAMARVIRDELAHKTGLVDEVVVFDDGLSSGLADAARAHGLALHDVAAQERGKAMWASLRVLTGDLVVWLDLDLRNMHAKFIYGLLGPLLRETRIGLVTGFYRVPDTLDDAAFDDGDALITELAVRPLLNLHFPELAGLINPLARERAARRDTLAGLRVLSGPGADMAMLLDVYAHGGVWAIAQTDLDERVGRSVSVAETARRSFATVRALAGRAPAEAVASASRPAHATLKLVRNQDERYYVEVADLTEIALPPVVRRRAVAGESVGPR